MPNGLTDDSPGHKLEDVPFSQEGMNELREQARAERRAWDSGEAIKVSLN
jgi:hypothetical protein